MWIGFRLHCFFRFHGSALRQIWRAKGLTFALGVVIIKVSPKSQYESPASKDHSGPGIPGTPVPIEGTAPGERRHTTLSPKAATGVSQDTRIRCRYCGAALGDTEALYWHWVGIHPEEKQAIDQHLETIDTKLQTWERVIEEPYEEMGESGGVGEGS